ncbi:polysaccharide deacetylase family protein [Oceanobacillus sp. FSL H7-0719]|uniref:polysaccharide deacetylase family protein n=1 Tax=Oceanobacillus sp. FSL H7-0719 TaxID=2954507 RepID=UPI0032471653
MHAYKKYVHIVVFTLILLISFNYDYNPLQLSPITTSISVSQSKDSLYKEIEEKAETYKEAPQNAYIDRVWKKTPGRNGKEVNIEKSYRNMKKAGVFREELLVYNDLYPEISLQDLPAAPIYRGHPEKEMVSFIINVSWGKEHIPAILETLNEYQVKASFFIEGKWARENAELVKMIKENGHIIGNHAYNHPDMARINRSEITDQIVKTNEILKAINSENPVYFTPPSGSFNDQVIQTAADLNMETVLWTVDTIDWKNPSISVMINRVSNNIHPGAIILMHPTQVIADGLDELILLIKEKGYKIGRIDSLLSEER